MKRGKTAWAGHGKGRRRVGSKKRKLRRKIRLKKA